MKSCGVGIACTAHNDANQVLADGPFATSDGNVLFSASLNVAGDEDNVAIFNNGANNVRMTAETFGPNGIGTCDATLVLDTVLNIRNAAGASLAFNDDNGVDFCSRIVFTVAPGQTVSAIDNAGNQSAQSASALAQSPA